MLGIEFRDKSYENRCDAGTACDFSGDVMLSVTEKSFVLSVFTKDFQLVIGIKNCFIHT